MKRRTKPMIIGAFVVGAFAIAAVALIIFGSGELLAEKYTHVAYFEGSVSGLDIGAPVSFRGVDIGEVTGVHARLTEDASEAGVEVVFEIDPERISLGEPINTAEDYWNMVDELIQRGLRAQIETKSFITGQRYINLVFNPKIPIVVHGTSPEYHEFPTAPAAIEQLRAAAGRAIETVSEFPFEDVFNQLLLTLEGIDEFVHSQELRDAIESISSSMDTLAATSARFDANIDSMVTTINITADSLQLTMREFRGAVARFERVASEDTPLHYELTTALGEFSSAARAMRVLAEYLEQHPEALIVGKEKREEK